jgi:hypothetical protein
MSATGAYAIAGAIPMVVPLGAIGAAFGLIFLGAFLLTLFILYTVPIFAEIAAEDSTGEGGGPGHTLIVFYTPGLGSLLGVTNVFFNAAQDVVSSLTSLFSSDIVRIVILFIMASVAAVWLAQHDLVYSAYRQAWSCDPLDTIKRDILRVANFARLAVGATYQLVNIVAGFDWSIPGVAIRTTLHCVLQDGRSVLEQVGLVIGNFLSLFFGAWGAFFDGSNGDLSTANVYLVPAFEALGAISPTFAQLLNCGCDFLSFVRSHLFFTLSASAWAEGPVRRLRCRRGGRRA